MIQRNRRILIVDDNPDIHGDFRTILGKKRADLGELDAIERELGMAPDGPPTVAEEPWELDSAHQGREALEMVIAAEAAGRPYALAFVDVRMPPGWDGVETVGRLWQVSPALEVVLCTAYSDYSWKEVAEALGGGSLVVLKKPFETIEVEQLAHTLTDKWYLGRCDAQKIDWLSGELAQAKKFDAIGRMAAGITHEINSPLQALTFSVDAIANAARRAGNTDEELATWLNDARMALGRMLEVSRSMRELSHPGTGKKTQADLNRSIRAAATLARNGRRDAEIELRLVELPSVTCNEGEMAQVILNLIVNAADASREAGRRAKIVVASRAGDGVVDVSVTDNGAGIPDAIRDKIFEPFVTTKAVGLGTGQGLAIARSIVVDRHGGKLLFDTRPGEGTTFTMRLPRDPVPIAMVALGSGAQR
jgi:two-component system, NtrC family, sensor kinase